MDYYKILNVKEDATLKEIEQAYKDLSSFYNPNNNVSRNAYRKYREIDKAYKVLSELKQKEMYDNLNVKEIEEEKLVKGELIEVNTYLSDSKTNFNNDILDLNSNPKDIYVSVKLSYLYYLTSSDYLVSYNRPVITYTNEVCPLCKGEGKVRFNNKVSICPDCFGVGKKGNKTYINEEILVNCNDTKVVIEKDDYKIVINFDYLDKEYFKVNNNEIFIDYKVSEEEYKNGLNYNLLKDEVSLNISSLGFNDTTYTFLDKIIHFNYILDSYKGNDKECYLLTNASLIYLNLKDFSYTLNADEMHTYKVNINDTRLVLEGLGDKGYNNKNGDLIINVIKVNNDFYNYLLFDRKIKKVSSNLFKLKGSYNNHGFNKNRSFDFDDNYIYLPSKAYKLKSKTYLTLKIIYILGYILIPLILYLIMGFSFAFFITSMVFFAIYLIASNLLMEVKL